MSKRGMTKKDRELHAALREMGCCVSLFVYGVSGTPCDIHHIVESGRRLGHNVVIPLSPTMHRQGNATYPSIHSVNGGHGGKSLFKKVYGYDEYELLAKCEDYLNMNYSGIAA